MRGSQLSEPGKLAALNSSNTQNNDSKYKGPIPALQATANEDALLKTVTNILSDRKHTVSTDNEKDALDANATM